VRANVKEKARPESHLKYTDKFTRNTIYEYKKVYEVFYKINLEKHTYMLSDLDGPS